MGGRVTVGTPRLSRTWFQKEVPWARQALAAAWGGRPVGELLQPKCLGLPGAGLEGAHRDSSTGIPRPPERNPAALRDLLWLLITQSKFPVLQFSPIRLQAHLAQNLCTHHLHLARPLLFPHTRHNCHHLPGTDPVSSTLRAR